jgi:hypothetical protein
VVKDPLGEFPSVSGAGGQGGLELADLVPADELDLAELAGDLVAVDGEATDLVDSSRLTNSLSETVA